MHTHTKLKKHLKTLRPAQQAVFAKKASTSVGYLRKVMSTNGSIGPALAVRIELASLGAVMRWDLRPDDWHLIWPELIGAAGAPPVPDTQPEPIHDEAQP